MKTCQNYERGSSCIRPATRMVKLVAFAGNHRAELMTGVVVCDRHPANVANFGQHMKRKLRDMLPRHSISVVSFAVEHLPLDHELVIAYYAGAPN